MRLLHVEVMTSQRLSLVGTTSFQSLDELCCDGLGYSGSSQHLPSNLRPWVVLEEGRVVLTAESFLKACLEI